MGTVEGGTQGARYTHLTTARGKVLIDESEVLLGRKGSGLYAFEGAPPGTFLRRVSGVGKELTKDVLIPDMGPGVFHKPLVVGPWTLLRRMAGVRVAPGSVNLATGEFLPYAAGKFSWFTQTSEWKFALADLGLDYLLYETGRKGYEMVKKPE